MASGRHVGAGEIASTPTERDPKPHLDPAAAHEECERILADPIFKNSKRSSELLKYLVDRTLEGRHDCLKERIIGIEVLGRSPDYDTNQDASVRGAIGDVRKRLIRYFENPLHHDEMRVHLPPGSYVVEFTAPQPLPVALNAAPVRQKFRAVFILVPIIAAGFLLAFLAARHLLWPTPPIDRFWAPMLSSSGPILISISSGATPTQQTSDAPPVDEASKNSLSQFISQQANFPMAELNSANSIDTYLATHGKRSTIQLDSSTTLSDLHQTPAVLLGSYVNQWAMRLGNGLHFRFQSNESDRLHWIEDTSKPGDRNWVVNLNTPYDQVKNEYALVTREFDPDTGQWWIGIGGLSVLGTLAAQHMLVEPDAMAALNAQLPKNWERKNLQIVIEVRLVNGSPGASRAVASYTW